jgi:uncharacterized protein (TIGR02231 family)
MDELVLDAPIVAVAVYPDRARITRRGRITVPAGDQTVYVEPLPLGLQGDSVRVAGRGPATVLGVDVTMRHHPQAPDQAVAELERQRREAEAEVGTLADADEVQAQLDTFLEQLARRAGGSFARALAKGDGSADLSGFTDSLAVRLAGVRARRRELAEQRIEAEERLAAAERRLAAIAQQRRPDRHTAVVALAVETDAEVEIELSYVVAGAGWTSSYDVRLTGERMTLNWYGMVTQHTGEDWPECELTLSTARPAAAAKVPELDPWYVDRYRPPVPMPPPAAAPSGRRQVAAYGAMALDAVGGAAEEFDGAPLVEAEATVEQGLAAASYTPTRPVAIPADGASHRATIAAIDLDAELDYVTAPVRSTDVHLRATVVNGSHHALPAGRAAVFHEADFVGSAVLPVWAPGEDVELALGLDDRVRVERKLVRRTASKATLGSTRKRETEYETTIANHTPRPIRLTVLDQLPVSRDHEITVKQLVAEPAPAETTDLGVLTWKLELKPGQETKVRFGLRVESGKSVDLAGWRE